MSKSHPGRRYIGKKRPKNDAKMMQKGTVVTIVLDRFKFIFFRIKKLQSLIKANFKIKLFLNLENLIDLFKKLSKIISRFYDHSFRVLISI